MQQQYNKAYIWMVFWPLVIIFNIRMQSLLTTAEQEPSLPATIKDGGVAVHLRDKQAAAKAVGD